MTKRKKPYTDKDLVTFAKKALHGLDESHVFLGILDDRADMSGSRVEFLLQLGHCVLMDKPIIIPVPYGTPLPKKLEAIADRIVRYDVNDPESLTRNLSVVLTEMGIVVQ